MNIILCAGKNGRAVIFGTTTAKPKPGEPVTLRNARMIIYWSTACGGLFGLAANGPKEGTLITCAVEETTETVWQEYIVVEDGIAKAISDWPVEDGIAKAISDWPVCND